MRPILLMTALGCLFFSCKPTISSPFKYTGEQLRFGSGGGFTGQETVVALLDDGEMFKLNGEDFQAYKRLSKRTTKQYFTLVENSNIKQSVFNKPENIYYFVELHQNGKKQRITWGTSDAAKHPQMDALYKSFMSVFNTAKPIKQKS